ncbi:MAG: GNAT family N-acetyltransferase [Verrucomicrobiota bacterium]
MKMAHRALSRLPTDLILREYQSDDLQKCSEIYTSNIREFLPNNLGLLIDHLSQPFSYFLVIETKETVIACGGMDLFAEANAAGFNFGLVLRDFHGQGLGTLLVLTRLALVDDDHDPAHISLETSVLTEPFYAKFGFERLSSPEQRYLEGTYYIMMGLWLTILERNEIRTFLKTLPVRFDFEFSTLP